MSKNNIEETDNGAVDETATPETLEVTEGDEEQGVEENPEQSYNEEDQAKVLIAQMPILYLSRQYKVGDELPASDADMVQAWISANSAVWMNVSEGTHKAIPVTAEPGLTGVSPASETEDNLVGKVPRTNTRKR